MIKRLLVFICKTILVVTALSLFALVYIVFYYTRDLPNYEQLSKYHAPLATRIYTIDGKLIEQYAKENRVFVSIKSLPKYLINAFIAAEDKHFYSHPGIDIYGIIRATLSNAQNIMQNKRLQGASTITQQVVKNLLLSNERSIDRKVKEAVLSYMISKTFTKDQILELYLNQTFFGKGAYGIGSASQTYFNKSPEELSLEEAAFIAGLPKAPSNFDPGRNYNRSKERRNYVIDRMLEDGYITPEEAKEAIASDIITKNRANTDIVKAGHVAELVRQIVSDIVGENEFYTEGYTVITTIDSKSQKHLTDSFVQGIRQFDQKKGFRKPIAKISTNDWHQNLLKIQDQINMREYKLAVVISITDHNATIGLKDSSTGIIPLSEAKWARTNLKSFKGLLNVGDVVVVERLAKNYGLRQIPIVNGGAVFADPRTGAVRAHVGGYDFTANKFDRVTQAIRQPGSTIKPFVYLAALEKGIPPNSIVDDSPSSFSQGKNMPLWTPKNYNAKYLGPITIRKALEKSANLATIKVAVRAGIKNISEILDRLSICPYPKPYLAMVIGAVDTTLSKMVNAYSMFANGGLQVMPHYIEMIQDRNGKIIYKRDDSVCTNCQNHDNGAIKLPIVRIKPRKRVIDERVAYQINSMLQGAVLRGTSSKLAKHKLFLASKTGTTNKSLDTWTISYTPSMIIGGYVGYDKPTTLGARESGATVALPIIDIFLDKIGNNITNHDFIKPEGVELIKVNPDSGIPDDSPGSITEVLIPDISEKQSDYRVHDQEIIVNQETIEKLEESVFEDTGEIY